MAEDTLNPEMTEAKPAEALKTVPYDRFEQVNSKLRALEKQLEEEKRDRAEKESQALLEQNNYKQLYEDLLKKYEPLKNASEKAERYQAALQATNETRINRIPEDKRGLIPEYDDPVKLGEWLDRNSAIITEVPKPKAPNLDGGANGNTSGNVTALSTSLQGIADIAREMGYQVSDERVSQYAKKPIKPTKAGDE